MGYKAYGVSIEGVGTVFGATGAAIWANGPLNIGDTIVAGATSKVRARCLVSPPQLSASEVDLLTGVVRSGAIAFQMHANDLVCAAFLGTVRARRPTGVLQADVTAAAITLDFGVALPTGVPMYLGEETIYINSLSSGTIYNVIRGFAGSVASGHLAGTNLYSRPPFWIGRAVTLYLLNLDDSVPALVQSNTVVWRGYLTEAPAAVSGTSLVSFKGEDALGTLRRAKINRDPLPHLADSVEGLVAYNGTLGVQVFGQLFPQDEADGFGWSRVRKLQPWVLGGKIKAMQIGQTVVITKDDVTVTGFAAMDSTRLVGGEAQAPPYWELAVWSWALDDVIQELTGADGVAPTRNCAYPFHPLTIAAALLFSSTDSVDEDVLVFDVMAPQFSLGVGYLADFTAWQNAISEDPHLRVDPTVLGWDGKAEDVWDWVTRKLLPAYGYVMSQTSAGLLSPVKVGLIDIEQYANAPLLTPLPGVWDWSVGAFSALDALTVTLGTLPWREGVTIQVNGSGQREATTGRATRILNPSSADLDWPTISAATAEAIGATTIASALIWRYDGLPVVAAQLQHTSTLRLGQVIRLAKMDGLQTPILFNQDGARVDDLWDTAALVAQIVSLRYNVDKNIYDVKMLLANYNFGKVAKWRAPAARIKSRPGTAQYLIEGTTSDFGEPDSDALRLTVGDQLKLVTKNLAPKASARTIIAIAPSGADYLVTLASDFSSVGVAGDWLYTARSEDYSNTNVVGGEPYPYVWMTTAATLARPGATTTPPDEYS